jgi:predicted secreted protein
MDLAWTLSLYFITWWMVLFAILPLGVRSHHDEGTTPPPGHDPGAPVNPNLKQKALTTSWVTAVIIGVVWIVVRFNLVQLPH